jgi:O-methyltransferase involved in polyketide biosynthesis
MGIPAYMPKKQSIQLGPAQETMLVPLYARALESRRKRRILDDPKAVEMVESIDWDFQRFGQRPRVFACSLRCALFDGFVADFLARHPEGTVVEIGAGLSTRFDRLDNGRVHWFDLDLPDAAELRRKFFTDTGRRTILAASVLDPDWIQTVRRSPGPYFFVAETVLVYLDESQVKAALSQIAHNFPGAAIAFDTGSRGAMDRGNRGFVHRKMTARFAWACEDPREIERWNIGLRLMDSPIPRNVINALKPRLSPAARTVLLMLAILSPWLRKAYRLNLFAIQPEP